MSEEQKTTSNEIKSVDLEFINSIGATVEDVDKFISEVKFISKKFHLILEKFRIYHN